jgi:uncharacterized membrane protein
MWPEITIWIFWGIVLVVLIALVVAASRRYKRHGGDMEANPYAEVRKVHKHRYYDDNVRRRRSD